MTRYEMEMIMIDNDCNSVEELVEKLVRKNNALEDSNKCKDRGIQWLSSRVYELEASQPKWISVEERLPDEGERVLVCEKRYVGISELDCERCGSQLSYWFDDYEDATHWMPLPPPIKENLITEQTNKSED